MKGNAGKQGATTDGCGFDYVADVGVEFFKIRHGYPLLNTKIRARPELAREGRQMAPTHKYHDGICAYEKLLKPVYATDSS